MWIAVINQKPDMISDPKNIRIEEFTYSLPTDRIADFPLADRAASKLLVVDEKIRQYRFRDISEHLPPGSIMVFNNSRVVEARLIFKKPTGASIEIFCLEPGDQYPDISTAFTEKKEVYWKCLVGNAASWPREMTLSAEIPQGVLTARQVHKQSDHFIIRLSWTNPSLSFAEILHFAGSVPLPPYIKRKAEASDTERYQTIYAQSSGSVAAPTAGLHFTDDVLEKLSQKEISKNFVTLHVGAGTFKPVKSETLSAHEMHSEYIEVELKLIKTLAANNNRPVIAVGTTSLRTLESLYWIGVEISTADTGNHLPEIKQWTPYENPSQLSASDALVAIIRWMEARKMDKLIAKTALIITPGYQFRMVHILVTNFHQPKSTLLLLIAAFIGEKWKSAYAYALENDFRFLSYGDSCLLFRQ